MAAVLLALGSSLSFGIADFFGGVVTRRIAVVVVLLVSQTVGLAGIARVVLVRGDGPPDAVFVPLALAASVLGVVGLAALYRGLATGMMSVVAPIAATASCVAVVAGFVTGETPTRLQNAGIARARRRDRVSLVRSEGAARMRLAAGAGLGPRRRHLRRLPELLRPRRHGRSRLGHARASDRLRDVARNRRAGRRPASLPRAGAATLLLLGPIGLLDVGRQRALRGASAKGVVGVVAVLTSLYPVVDVALARFVLKERLQPRQAWARVRARRRRANRRRLGERGNGTVRVRGPSNSQKKIPCHVPSARSPSRTGTTSDVAVSAARDVRGRVLLALLDVLPAPSRRPTIFSRERSRSRATAGSACS